MSGPAYRFWALKRWWALLAIFTVLTVGGIAAEGSEDAWILALAFGIVFAVLWIPSVLTMLLVPRLRGFIAMVFCFVGLGRYVIPGVYIGTWEAAVIFIGVFLILVLGARIRMPFRLRGQVRIDRPVSEVAQTIELRPRGQTWQRIVDRIEVHPDNPDLLRAFTAGPVSKVIPNFDVDVLSRTPNGGIRWQVFCDNPAWQGSSCDISLAVDGDATLVTYNEVSKGPVIGVLTSWLDDAGQDAMYELKFFVEGQSDWTIRAGEGRWWPTWSPPPDAAVF